MRLTRFAIISAFVTALCRAVADRTAGVGDAERTPGGSGAGDREGAAAGRGRCRGAVIAPTVESSVRFAVLGDTGTGDRAQYQVGEQLAKARAVFPFEFVIMLGDNMYGSERPQDYQRKFELPYKAILDAKVPFYASLGNHDDPNQRFYKPFNMNGERYYSFKKDKLGNPGVRFFALDSNYMTPDQLAVAREGARGLGFAVEDRVLPPPALLVRRAARFGDRPARPARAALPQARHDRRLRGARALLRAAAAAEGRLTTSPPAARRSCASATSPRRR